MNKAKKYTTISISMDVKKMLDNLRGDKNWSEFLRDLVLENMRLKRILAARKIQERFNERVEKSIMESHLAFKKSFRLRDFHENRD